MIKWSVEVDKEQLKLIKRWLEYVPEFWNIAEISKKTLAEASLIELERIKAIKESVETVSFIDEVLGEVEDNFVMLTYDKSEKLKSIQKDFELDEVALAKISNEDIIAISALLNSLDGTNYEEASKMLTEFSNPYVLEFAELQVKKWEANFRAKKNSNEPSLSRKKGPARGPLKPRPKIW